MKIGIIQGGKFKELIPIAKKIIASSAAQQMRITNSQSKPLEQSAPSDKNNKGA